MTPPPSQSTPTKPDAPASIAAHTCEPIVYGLLHGSFGSVGGVFGSGGEHSSKLLTPSISQSAIPSALVGPAAMIAAHVAILISSGVLHGSSGSLGLSGSLHSSSLVNPSPSQSAVNIVSPGIANATRSHIVVPGSLISSHGSSGSVPSSHSSSSFTPPPSQSTPTNPVAPASIAAHTCEPIVYGLLHGSLGSVGGVFGSGGEHSSKLLTPSISQSAIPILLIAPPAVTNAQKSVPSGLSSSQGSSGSVGSPPPGGLHSSSLDTPPPSQSRSANGESGLSAKNSHISVPVATISSQSHEPSNTSTS